LSACRRTGRVGDERRLDAWAKYHVDATPGLLVDKLPAVPGSRGVLGQKDVARVQHEVLAGACLKVKRAAQGNDELARGCVVPFEGTTGSCLAKRDANDIDGVAENVTAFTLGKVNDPFLEMR